jgi:hypothetical protein
MAQEISETIELLRQSIAGSLMAPEDPEYDQARRVWNADIDRRPAGIVQCASAQDCGRHAGPCSSSWIGDCGAWWWAQLSQPFGL